MENDDGVKSTLLDKTQPVNNMKWILRDRITPNDYNPNSQATPEHKLLIESLLCDGWTQPIVVRYNHPSEWIIVDGAHRWQASGDPRVIEKYGDRVPVVELQPETGEEAMASTVRHNRARGAHGVSEMADIIADLKAAGWDRERMKRELGMSEDELQRFEIGERLPALLSGRDCTMRS